MLYSVILILLLVTLAGVIAYAGDVLGATVGRRRLSLFGWRPRRTGQIVGVAAGVLIMLTTMSTLALAFRSAATVIMNAERVGRELTTLRREQSDLLVNIDGLERAIEERAVELQEARATIETAEAQRDEAVRERDGVYEQTEVLQRELLEVREQRREAEEDLRVLSGDLSRIRTELVSTEGALTQAQADLVQAREDATEAKTEQARLQDIIRELNKQQNDLRRQSGELRQTNEDLLLSSERLEASHETLLAQADQQAQELRKLQEQTKLVESGQIAFKNNELIYNARVQAQEVAEVQAALNEVILAADTVARQRGADRIYLTAAQFNGLVASIVETPGEDFVALLSNGNQFQGFRPEVRVESRENLKLLDRGQLLLSRPVHLGSEASPIAQETVRGELRRLRSDADRELKALGLFEFELPRFSVVSEDTFMASLRRLRGPVVIGVVAHEPVHVSGPAELDFVIVR
ncbi:MAG: DUF3084 domain-containing protein [Deinococcota bacterium]|nr:DUF3084 domain-containing protein [Deinococcota bacterium]